MSGVNLEVDLGRLRLPNPVMVASGTFGFGQEYASLMDLSRLGGIVTKGISLEPRQGNPSPENGGDGLWHAECGGSAKPWF